jgi:hypothetical protein
MLYYISGRGAFWGNWIDQQLNRASGEKYQLRTKDIIQNPYLVAESLKGEDSSIWGMCLEWNRKWEDPE